MCKFFNRAYLSYSTFCFIPFYSVLLYQQIKVVNNVKGSDRLVQYESLLFRLRVYFRFLIMISILCRAACGLWVLS